MPCSQREKARSGSGCRQPFPDLHPQSYQALQTANSCLCCDSQSGHTLPPVLPLRLVGKHLRHTEPRRPFTNPLPQPHPGFQHWHSNLETHTLPQCAFKETLPNASIISANFPRSYYFAFSHTGHILHQCCIPVTHGNFSGHRRHEPADKDMKGSWWPKADPSSSFICET